MPKAAIRDDSLSKVRNPPIAGMRRTSTTLSVLFGIQGPGVSCLGDGGEPVSRMGVLRVSKRPNGNSARAKAREALMPDDNQNSTRTAKVIAGFVAAMLFCSVGGVLAYVLSSFHPTTTASISAPSTVGSGSTAPQR